MTLRALVLDPSLTQTGYAIVDLPLRRDARGLYAPELLALGDQAGVIDVRDPKPIRATKRNPAPVQAAKATEQWRVMKLYLGIEALLLREMNAGRPIDLVAAEIPPNIYGRKQTSELAVRYQIASYTTVRVVTALNRYPLVEVDPKWSKKSLVGNVNANKEQVREAVTVLTLGDKDAPLPEGWRGEDTVDALAVGFWLNTQIDLARQGYHTPIAGLLTELLGDLAEAR